MASTYSSNLKIELIGTGDQSGLWGTTTNDNFSNVFEQAIVGRGNPDFATDADLTLTYTDTVASQTARNLYLNVTSTGSLTATRNLIVPTIYKNYIIQNNTTGGQSIVVKTAAGTGITVSNGSTMAVYVNGTNVIKAFDYGTVTSVSVASANGFAGTSSGSPTAPSLTLSTSVTGLLKGNGTAISAASSGTDYAPATSGTSILKGNGSGGFSSAAAGTDYAAATTGTSAQLLANNGSGGFSNVTVGSGLSYAGGNLTATGSGGTVTSVSWTGGIVSIADPTTTPAFTIAGTSGGIPYFSSTSTWASSGALAANALLIGGGAGAAPSSTTTGTGVLTAIGNAVNTTNGVVTQTATLTASALLLGGGSGTGIASTTTGTGVVTALGTAANASGGFATTNGTATLTNKRIDPRVFSTTSASAVTADISSYDQYCFTALAATLTINAPTGTPVDGDKIVFRFLDNGGSQTLSWNATFTAIGVTIPTATTASKMTYVGCIYNAANTRWDVIAVATQA